MLLIHGGGEDAALLDAQAEAIAVRGFRVVWYDRRGTGGSTRDCWPGGGADQHADDAARLLGEGERGRCHGARLQLGWHGRAGPGRPASRDGG
ncbi:alpha/beta fold hydrolase [Actinoplanes sp. NPDC004185]